MARIRASRARKRCSESDLFLSRIECSDLSSSFSCLMCASARRSTERSQSFSSWNVQRWTNQHIFRWARARAEQEQESGNSLSLFACFEGTEEWLLIYAYIYIYICCRASSQRFFPECGAVCLQRVCAGENFGFLCSSPATLVAPPQNADFPLCACFAQTSLLSLHPEATEQTPLESTARTHGPSETPSFFPELDKVFPLLGGMIVPGEP